MRKKIEKNRKLIFVKSITASKKYLEDDKFLKPIGEEERSELQEDKTLEMNITADEYQKMIKSGEIESKFSSDHKVSDWMKLSKATVKNNSRKKYYTFK